jgi:hypothetical protein
VIGGGRVKMTCRCGTVQKCQSNIETTGYRPQREKASKQGAARCRTSSGLRKTGVFGPRHVKRCTGHSEFGQLIFEPPAAPGGESKPDG